MLHEHTKPHHRDDAGMRAFVYAIVSVVVSLLLVGCALPYGSVQCTRAVDGHWVCGGTVEAPPSLPPAPRPTPAGERG